MKQAARAGIVARHFEPAVRDHTFASMQSMHARTERATRAAVILKSRGLSRNEAAVLAPRQPWHARCTPQDYGSETNPVLERGARVVSAQCGRRGSRCGSSVGPAGERVGLPRRPRRSSTNRPDLGNLRLALLRAGEQVGARTDAQGALADWLSASSRQCKPIRNDCLPIGARSDRSTPGMNRKAVLKLAPTSRYSSERRDRSGATQSSATRLQINLV